MKTTNTISQAKSNTDTSVTNAKKNVYIFGWPSFLGGADTKLAHLVDLLSDTFNLTLVPNDFVSLVDNNAYWAKYIKSKGAKCHSLQSLPAKLDGVALSMCNEDFLNKGICKIAKEKGLKVIWSSEMMWHFNGEWDAIAQGYIDKILYVSEIQKSKMRYPSNLPYSITGNYINPIYFPFKDRDYKGNITVGRLSRHDPDKYTENFPLFYDALEIPNVKFRVMAWSEDLEKKYSWYDFDDRWELLFPTQEDTVTFLHSLDLFVYPLGHRFIESWGRSTVEAMLTGCIPFCQTGHHLENLIKHGHSGYICDDIQELREIIHKLLRDKNKLKEMSINCRTYAEEVLCNREEHIKIWKEAFDV